MLLEITVGRLFAPYCSGVTFRHDDAMRERFGHCTNNANPSLESQITVSSASHDTRFSQDSVNDPASDHHSQPLSLPTQEYHPGSAASPELGVQADEVEAHEPQAWDLEMAEPIDELAALDSFHPTGLIDSQNPTISELALETRLQAFQALLKKAQGKAGAEIGLMSTTDNHSKLEEELG